MIKTFLQNIFSKYYKLTVVFLSAHPCSASLAHLDIEQLTNLHSLSCQTFLCWSEGRLLVIWAFQTFSHQESFQTCKQNFNMSMKILIIMIHRNSHSKIYLNRTTATLGFCCLSPLLKAEKTGVFPPSREPASCMHFWD